MSARELAERLRAALREERLAANTAAYFDGTNGTAQEHARTVAAVDALVDELDRWARTGRAPKPPKG